MSVWITLDDITDNSINVVDTDIDEANVYVDAVLKSNGIDPSSDVLVGNAHLKKLAEFRACQLACIREATDEGSVYFEKSKMYEKLVADYKEKISPSVLGITTESSNIFSLEVGRR